MEIKLIGKPKDADAAKALNSRTITLRRRRGTDKWLVDYTGPCVFQGNECINVSALHIDQYKTGDTFKLVKFRIKETVQFCTYTFEVEGMEGLGVNGGPVEFLVGIWAVNPGREAEFR